MRRHDVPPPATFSHQLVARDIVRTGTFTLKSGIRSPLYVDFKRALSDPVVFTRCCTELSRVVRNVMPRRAAPTPKREEDRRGERNGVARDTGIHTTAIAAVPMGAIPYATSLASQLRLPHIMVRPGVKQHGTKQQIEAGDLVPSATDVILVDDVVTRGGSALNIANILTGGGFRVRGIVVLLDRRRAYADLVLCDGVIIPVHAVLTIQDILAELVTMPRRLPCSDIQRVYALSMTPGRAREHVLRHGVSKRLWHLMHEKRSALVLSADVSTMGELEALLHVTHPYVCMVKLHPELVTDFDVAAVHRLSNHYRVLWMADMKYGDIGSITARQFRAHFGGIQDVYPHFTTVHGISGPDACQQVARVSGAVLVTDMSSKGCLMDGAYRTALQQGDVHAAAFVTQHPGQDDTRLYMTPGVSTKQVTGDGAGQQYETIATKFARGTDLVIIGRAIYAARDQGGAAAAFAKESWACFCRVNGISGSMQCVTSRL